MKYLLTFIVTCFNFFCFSQEIIKGIIVDSATFAPLPYVSVQVKNKLNGTTTDNQGNFSLLATRRDTLIFSLLGYEKLIFPLYDYEPSLIRMAQRTTMLRPITIDDSRLNDNPYEGLFDEQNAARRKAPIPFYYKRAKKDKIRTARLREENIHVKTYVDVIINDPKTKSELMKNYNLTETEYYKILTKFNEKYYNVMYFLTTAELKSFLNRFYESQKVK